MRNDVTMESMIMDGMITDGPFGIYPVINSFNAVTDTDFVDDPFFPDDPEVLMATGAQLTHFCYNSQYRFQSLNTKKSSSQGFFQDFL